ncbi:8429_t:CDS:2 [Funneliformis caledonium]|uniref:8429_t:CDS:1 n=1 Tax=Funneliformis caledonium TaxID=1117310 RepID=A0A9N8VHI4_9GLOM|nr:8429_t:CDS:2 [Funneliformis caledonium]
MAAQAINIQNLTAVLQVLEGDLQALGQPNSALLEGDDIKLMIIHSNLSLFKAYLTVRMYFKVTLKILYEQNEEDTDKEKSEDDEVV